MSNDSQRGRRSIRLKHYDYGSDGHYFITACTHHRQHLFGKVADGEMVLSRLGQELAQCWEAIPAHFPFARLDEFCVMPDHFHGVLVIEDENGNAGFYGERNFSPASSATEMPTGTSRTVGSIVRGMKIGVTKWARQHTNVHTVWQRNYYEHIVRDEAALARIRSYILRNPQTRWENRKST